MIYEYRDSRGGHVFAGEYGQSMCATKMMYAAACHDVPMCRIEWATQTARERFEAWWLNCPEWWPPSTDPAWAAWQAAERSAIERAAKVADELSDCSPSYIGEAIRGLIT